MLGGEPLLQLLAGRDQALGLGLTQVELDAVAEQGGVAAETHPARRLVGVDRVAAGELAQPDIVVAQRAGSGSGRRRGRPADGRSPCGCRSHGRRSRRDGPRTHRGCGRCRAGRPGSAPRSRAAGRADRAGHRRRTSGCRAARRVAVREPRAPRARWTSHARTGASASCVSPAADHPCSLIGHRRVATPRCCNRATYGAEAPNPPAPPSHRFQPQLSWASALNYHKHAALLPNRSYHNGEIQMRLALPLRVITYRGGACETVLGAATADVMIGAGPGGVCL